jgi:hypothetical protein
VVMMFRSLVRDDGYLLGRAGSIRKRLLFWVRTTVLLEKEFVLLLFLSRYRDTRVIGVFTRRIGIILEERLGSYMHEML